MAIIAVFDVPGGTQAQYEQVCDRLSGGNGVLTSLSDAPEPGLLSHIAGPTPTGWLVVEVWESEQAFQRFGQKLAPFLEEAGMPDLEPKVYQAFNVVTD
ncbi:antibiotic biosynthesis monooxygenase [Streptomyces sp. NBC_01775]|uniref:antibiotic biosynthesis monooxygenase n=1 Tax=Streptomyces sp. NBC_01775 TaxID=2975939 RepID=UPI002DD927E4|nr:antibiotic biosynthesis monooxygenase [Streptomyces sp. NBC_01775]WSB77251.1 antibiotic biosynthesis monooxygenase [Streptomyces sp. NBC_01775]